MLDTSQPQTQQLRSLWLLLACAVIVSARHPACNNKGFMEHRTKKCVCATGYYGPTCTLRVCPFGIAWVGIPTADDTAHSRKAECSNMGVCDRSTGKCTCRVGFEGPACERLWCPRENGVDCSGNGRCMSLSQAGAEWDGAHLIRDPERKSYNDAWDAKKIYGCICDPGWAGYDCSVRQCLNGYDGVVANPKPETFIISCKADQGHFSLFKGGASLWLPFDATASDLEHMLQRQLPIQSATVEVLNSDFFVCGSDSPTNTRLTLIGDFGRPTMARISAVAPALPELYSLTTNATSLESVSGNPFLALGTEYILQCVACTSCAGSFFFDYNGDVTDAVDPYVMSAQDLQMMLQSLSTVTSGSEFGDLVLRVQSSHATLCDAGADVTTTIIFFGTYANVGELTLVNSVRATDFGGPSTVADQKLSAVLISPHRHVSLSECSGAGICDEKAGLCNCFVEGNGLNRTNDQLYLFQSSNGYGEPGSRPDCGYSSLLPDHCIDDCNSNGVCELSETGRYYCVCAAGFTGATCAERECPKAAPWFSEPYEIDNAHTTLGGEVECAAMGLCNRKNGRCRCRDGFFGSACQYMDCPTDISRSRCSGHGQCLSLRQLAHYSQQKDGSDLDVVYGVDKVIAWDADRIYGCLCDNRNYMQSRNGPITTINGFDVNNPSLPGYHGYDCSLRSCPVGDDPLAPGGFEVQEVTCALSDNVTYTLHFRGERTAAIAVNASIEDIERALNRLPTIGSVRVSLATGSNATCDEQGAKYQVTFLTEFGAIPLLSASNAELMFVHRTIPGTKQALECGGRGVCDHATGLCSCTATWHSSDGDGNLGTLGDCGYVDPYGN